MTGFSVDALFTLPLLSIVALLPAAGAILILFVPRSQTWLIKSIALLAALGDLAVFGLLFARYQPGTPGFQFVERLPWVPALGVEYHLGLDGISLLLIGLNALLTLVAVVGAWGQTGERTKTFYGFLLLLASGVAGAFVAADLIVFFFFWEAMLIPMVLLIGTLGGPRRAYAAIKFFLYTAIGSLIMLLGILALYFYSGAQTGRSTFDYAILVQMRLPADVQLWLFLAFAFAFAIKVPVFPFHTWLPDAYAEAPTVALVLATMLTKVGAYGFIRFTLPLFPEGAMQAAPYLSALAVVGILYGGALAIAQRNIVRLLAYSSLAHLSLVVLGIFALNQEGVQGAVLQMVNHGITTGALFLIAVLIFERTGIYDLGGHQGLGARWPVMASFFLIATFSSIGLPGLNNFAGEFLILLGSFQAWRWTTIVAVLGIVLAAVYLLRLYGRLMHGRPASEVSGPDLRLREGLVLLPLALLIVGIGLYPNVLLSRTEASVAAALRPVQAAVGSRQTAVGSPLPGPSDDCLLPTAYCPPAGGEVTVWNPRSPR